MLEIRNITKSYKGETVLADLNFFLPEGQVLCLVGDNGSGKTTLFNIIAGITKPDGGDILYNGKSVLKDKRFLREKIGYVPQKDMLNPALKVKEQLSLWRSACGLSGEPDLEFISRFGVDKMLSKYISSLSGGMMRRVSLVMALSSSPEILLLDESTSALDEGYREELFAYIKEHRTAGGSVILCTHIKEERIRLGGTEVYLSQKINGIN